MCCGLCSSLAKILLFIFNVVFFLSGVALITVGSYIISEFNPYVDLIDYELIQLSILYIVIGCVIILVTAFGCDFCKKWKALMIIYIAFLVLIFLGELAGASAAFALRDDIRNETETTLTFENYNPTKDSKEWNNMQSEAQCCGASGPSDWGTDVPDSCCMLKSLDGTSCSTWFTEGCDKAVGDLLYDRLNLLGGTGIAFSILQLCGIAICLFNMLTCCC